MAKLTSRGAKELIAHEGIVREAYKDSKGIWTWSVGITSASGIKVYPDFVDKPQTMRRCLEAFIDRLNKNYTPAVNAAFKGHALTEAQFTAALSFHFNTGGIKTATWVSEWKAGKVDAARKSIMNWKKPPEIIPRREKERDLFFNGKWSSKGKSTEFPVKKPSYTPDFAKAKIIDVSADLDALLP